MNQWISHSLDHIQNTKIVDFGIPSDHSAMLICLKFKNPTNDKVFPDEVIVLNLLLDEDVILIKASNKVVLCAKAKSKRWYKNIIPPLVDKMSEISHSICQKILK